MIFLLLAVLVYAVTIFHLVLGYGKVHAFEPDDATPETYFSIVVPFRNEAANLPALLETFRNLDYPIDLFEIILVDDFSEDNGQRIVYDWRMENGSYEFTLLENIKRSGSPKKDAIARAVPIAKGSWVITTDADCRVPASWLRTFDRMIAKEKLSMIAAPVTVSPATGLLGKFQQLDWLSLQGATIGSFGMGIGMMCNGANFAYEKAFFQELGGFGNTEKHAGGDDVLLLQKAVACAPNRVGFLKSRQAIVQTNPEKSWHALLGQRVRWAAKTGGYKSVFARDLAWIVFGGNLAVVIAAVSLVLEKLSPIEFGVLFALKLLVDAVLIAKTEKLLQTESLWWLVPASIFYPIWNLVVAVALPFGFRWKGRKFTQ